MACAWDWEGVYKSIDELLAHLIIDIKNIISYCQRNAFEEMTSL